MGRWARALLLVGLFWACAAGGAAAADLAAMPATDILKLQQRLADAGCYVGPVDGKPSPALEKAVAACPPPRLRIETGMHLAAIERIGVDGACRLAATASDDGTVRVWSLPAGRLLRTLRMPIGPGSDGKMSAVAVSPDGRYLAAGTSDARQVPVGDGTVYLFNAATGALVAHAAEGANVLDLAFSQDGRFLAATLGQGQGLRILDVSNGHEVFADHDYADDSYGASFGPDGRLYTVAYDDTVRRYGRSPGFAKEAEAKTVGERPFSVSVDPKGELLIVGYADGAKVDAYDAATLGLRFAADTSAVRGGDVAAVAWRADGAAFVAGGSYQVYINGHWRHVLESFSRTGVHKGSDIALSANTIINIQTCGAGFALAAADPAFGLLDGEGRPKLWRDGAAPDLRRELADALTISADAKRVRFSPGEGTDVPLLVDLAGPSLGEAPAPDPALVAAATSGLPIANWQGRTDPTFGNEPLALSPFETARALAVRADLAGFVLGTDYFLRAFDGQGNQVWQKPSPDVVWGVDLSGDGRLLVAAYGDGTVRWHRASDGQELLALFVNRKSRAWILFTPSGYYTSSPGGEDMIGFELDHGFDQPAEFVAAQTYRDTYARPDVISRVLDTLDEGEAVRLADIARTARPEPATAPRDLPPVISILSPIDGWRAEGPDVTIDYIVRSPSGAMVDTVDALIDGKPPGTRGLEPLADSVSECIAQTHGLGRTEGALQGCRGSLQVTLPPGTVEIGLVARAGARASDVAKVHVTRVVAAAVADVLKPTLYALVVGVSDYLDQGYRLEFAAKDARDFAQALENQRGGLYRDVSVKLLADRDATTASIRDGLDWLSQHVTDRDVGVVYLSGHGDLDERGRFYFLAADSRHERLRATALPRDDVSDVLNGLAGKAVLFLDACHAGAVADGHAKALVDFTQIVKEFAQTERGVVVFAASTGRQLSLEDDAWGNGAFTKALVEGIGTPGHPGLADIGHTGTITLALLDAYVAQRVKELTHGRQSPVMINSTAPDFPIAVAR